MGNPHLVFFVEDLAAMDVANLGPAIETDPIAPRRANVGFAQVLDRERLRLRVWERGAGLTRACGTGAGAAVVAAARRGLVDRQVQVTMDGGDLEVAWRGDGHVVLTGAVAVEGGGWLGPPALSA